MHAGVRCDYKYTLIGLLVKFWYRFLTCQQEEFLFQNIIIKSTYYSEMGIFHLCYLSVWIFMLVQPFVSKTCQRPNETINLTDHSAQYAFILTLFHQYWSYKIILSTFNTTKPSYNFCSFSILEVCRWSCNCWRLASPPKQNKIHQYAYF